MSVYTPLTLEQVQAFARGYGLVVNAISPIQGGIENTNYFLHCNHADYVLTLFEVLDFAAAAELAPVLALLAEQDVPVAKPLAYNDAYIHELLGKPAQITPRMAGQHPMQPNLAQVRVIAQAQARMHLALQHQPIQRSTNSNQQYWNVLAAELLPDLCEADQALLMQVQQLHATAQQQHPNRPQGWIHADLFRDNCLFVADQLSAILDFSELSLDDLLYDIAITINDFCRVTHSPNLDDALYQAYLNAYAEVRPFTADEQACLPIYLATAACRFWITRVQTQWINQQQGRLGNDILQKDPAEMRSIVLDCLTQINQV